MGDSSTAVYPPCPPTTVGKLGRLLNVGTEDTLLQVSCCIDEYLGDGLDYLSAKVACSDIGISPGSAHSEL